MPMLYSGQPSKKSNKYKINYFEKNINGKKIPAYSVKQQRQNSYNWAPVYGTFLIYENNKGETQSVPYALAKDWEYKINNYTHIAQGIYKRCLYSRLYNKCGKTGILVYYPPAIIKKMQAEGFLNEDGEMSSDRKFFLKRYGKILKKGKFFELTQVNSSEIKKVIRNGQGLDAQVNIYLK